MSADIHKFIVELEFVQCLANPQYLYFLSRRGVLSDIRFLRFLKYLEYWRQPEYAVHLQYPQCLAVLTCLQDPAFRKQIGSETGLMELQRQQSYGWLYFNHQHRDLIPYQHWSLCYTVKEMSEQAKETPEATVQ
ncbi:MAG: hypothetical protein KVP17_004486 [Porospora cf. gigantea B]|uniref:uncharacterized protein n=1 Tax=Porospora cf. gigantea B TaxID=2853592 RepID=UPI003571C104|nr:MAG: hypothetical protein KVP17_004486 [Porospora cf. gigantea B]